MAMTKVMSHNSFEDGDFDETLYPVSTRAQQEVEDRFPLSCKRMQDDQLSDVKLMKTVKKSIDKKEKKYSYKKVEEVELVHKDGKILVPPAARPRVLDWYHQHLVHPGIERMYSTIKINYTWSELLKDCEKYCKSCERCQLLKKTNKRKVGLLPEKKGELTKWLRVNVDLWGPKTVNNVNGFT